MIIAVTASAAAVTLSPVASSARIRSWSLMIPQVRRSPSRVRSMPPTTTAWICSSAKMRAITGSGAAGSQPIRPACITSSTGIRSRRGIMGVWTSIGCAPGGRDRTLPTLRPGRRGAIGAHPTPGCGKPRGRLGAGADADPAGPAHPVGMVLATATPAPARPHLIDADGGEVRETHISWVFLTRGPRVQGQEADRAAVPGLRDARAPPSRSAARRCALNRRLAPDAVPRRAVADPGRRRAAARGRGRPARRRLRGRDAALRRVGDVRRAAARGRGRARGRRGRRARGWPPSTRRPRSTGAPPAPRRSSARSTTTSPRCTGCCARARRDRARSSGSAGAHLAALWDELDARAAGGLVRDGHGDLRLEHVLLGERVERRRLRRVRARRCAGSTSRPTSRSSLMELHEAGRADLADALVRGVPRRGRRPRQRRAARASSPPTARRCAPRWRCCAPSSAGRQPPSPTARTRSGSCALAARLRWRAHAPLVIAVAGVSASGKSTRRRGARRRVRLPRPQLRRGAQAAPPGCARPSARRRALYADDVSRATYAALARGRRRARRDGRDRRRDLPAALPIATRSAPAWGRACGCCGSSWSCRPRSWSGARPREPPTRRASRTPGSRSCARQLRTRRAARRGAGCATTCMVRADRSPDGDPRRDRATCRRRPGSVIHRVASAGVRTLVAADGRGDAVCMATATDLRVMLLDRPGLAHDAVAAVLDDVEGVVRLLAGPRPGRHACRPT